MWAKLTIPNHEKHNNSPIAYIILGLRRIQIRCSVARGCRLTFVSTAFFSFYGVMIRWFASDSCHVYTTKLAYVYKNSEFFVVIRPKNVTQYEISFMSSVAVDYRGPTLQTLVNFNPSMDKVKCGMKLPTHFQTPMVAQLKFGNG